jgi:small subunit ribosomal protein S3
MGQKVNPHGARVGVIFGWSTRWYANKKDFANNLIEDVKIRKMLKEKYYQTGISHIDVERSANRITVNIFTAKPGMIIGRGGAGIEALKRDIDTFLGKPANINIMEIKSPEQNAQLVAAELLCRNSKRLDPCSSLAPENEWHPMLSADRVQV